MNKKEFSQFIAQKRLAAGYTQKQLAELLYVDHSTVSKWERGLSYPDITLISKICGLLSISEHEFLTACGDTQARKEKKEARRWRGLKKGFQLAFAGGVSLRSDPLLYLQSGRGPHLELVLDCVFRLTAGRLHHQSALLAGKTKQAHFVVYLPGRHCRHLFAACGLCLADRWRLAAGHRLSSGRALLRRIFCSPGAVPGICLPTGG